MPYCQAALFLVLPLSKDDGAEPENIQITL